MLAEGSAGRQRAPSNMGRSSRRRIDPGQRSTPRTCAKTDRKHHSFRSASPREAVSWPASRRPMELRPAGPSLDRAICSWMNGQRRMNAVCERRPVVRRERPGRSSGRAGLARQGLDIAHPAEELRRWCQTVFGHDFRTEAPSSRPRTRWRGSWRAPPISGRGGRSAPLDGPVRMNWNRTHCSARAL